MRQDFTYSGQWFLPSNPDRISAGTLKFNHNKEGSLDLIEGLTGSVKKNTDVDIILGTTTTGKLVTLYKCYENHWTFNSEGKIATRWSVLFIILGGHFQSKEDLTFSSAAASFHNLDEWLAFSGFKIKEWRQKHKLQVNFNLPKNMPFEIDERVMGFFNFTMQPPSIGLIYDINLKQESQLLVQVKKNELEFMALLDYATLFQDFLTLGTYEASFPLSIQMKKQLKDETSGKPYFEVYDLYYVTSVSASSGRQKILWEFLFNFQDIKRNHKKILKKWFENCKAIEPVLKLLLDTFYQPGSFNENKFLNITQALETFHRRTRKNTVLTEKQHRKRIDDIKKSIPRKHSQFMDGRLMHSNEPSLHQRLEALFKEFNTKTFSKIVSDQNLLIKQTKDSRNYYTHYDAKMEKKRLKDSELYYLTEKLKVILICAILKETNLSSDLIEVLLERNQYKFFSHILLER
jgi:hypothetical protein